MVSALCRTQAGNCRALPKPRLGLTRCPVRLTAWVCRKLTTGCATTIIIENITTKGRVNWLTFRLGQSGIRSRVTIPVTFSAAPPLFVRFSLVILNLIQDLQIPDLSLRLIRLWRKVRNDIGE